MVDRETTTTTYFKHHHDRLLTGNTLKEMTESVHIRINPIQKSDVSKIDKLKSLRVLRRLPSIYKKVLEWIIKSEESNLTSVQINETKMCRARGTVTVCLDDIVLCLPSRFDVSSELLTNHFQLLAERLNASNAKYLSDALLCISRRVNHQMFLSFLLDFIESYKFQVLGASFLFRRSKEKIVFTFMRYFRRAGEERNHSFTQRVLVRSKFDHTNSRSIVGQITT